MPAAHVLRIHHQSPTLSDAFERYQTHCRIQNYSERTLSLQQDIFHSLGRFLGREAAPLEVLTPDTMRQYFDHLHKRIQPPTIKRYYSVLRCWMRFCVGEGMLPEDPMAGMKPPKVAESVIKPLTTGEVERLLAACAGKRFEDLRNAAMVMVLYDCGLRASELCNLSDADIDWGERVLLIRQSKNGRTRRVPFGETTARALSGYLARRGPVPSERLFVTVYGDAMDRNRVLKLLKRLGEKAQVADVHPHRLRHSCAVAFLRNGGDVFTLQKLLGHSTLAMSRHYCHLADTDVQEKHRLYSPADRLQPPKSGERRKRLR